MRLAVICLLSTAFLCVIAWAALYWPTPTLTERAVLHESGLAFSSQPRLTRHLVQDSGPGGSDKLVVMEFELDSGDIAKFSACTMPAYHRGAKHEGRYLVMNSFSRQADNPAEVCWSYATRDGDHMYALFESKLFYQFLSPVGPSPSHR